MIPKIVHYCWLSDDAVPDALQKCMKSWSAVLPDYEIVRWDFNRFPKGKSKWVDEAYGNRRYAFAADYIRLYALYNYGGIYLDMDVEVVKTFDSFLHLKTMLCYENSADSRLEVAAFGVEKGSLWVKRCLEYYENRCFKKADGSFDTKVLPLIIRDCLRKNAYVLNSVETIRQAEACSGNAIPVFPFDFFSPKSYVTGKIEKTERTCSIHHFAGTWLPWYCRLEKKICSALGLAYKDFLHRHFSK